MEIGRKLKTLRKLKDISQEELSKLLDISKTNIARYETNKQLPSAEIIKKLAEFFEVSADYFLFDEEDKIPSAAIKNRTLLKQFEAVDSMDEYHRNLVIGLIDCVIAKQKINDMAKKPGSE
ncbi:MAG: helix-turn-helix transcriptional regulator [bacterium]|nr:helix-turn-helix transcriptional regulator [bacterium]